MSAYAQISGHLGQDVELRQTNGGTPVVNLSLASNRYRKNAEGEKINIADWFRVTVYGRDAEVLAQYARKGSAVAFNGRLQTDSYVDREGVQRTATILMADSFEFMPSAKRAEGGGEAKVDRQPRTAAQDNSEEDIPF